MKKKNLIDAVSEIPAIGNCFDITNFMVHWNVLFGNYTVKNSHGILFSVNAFLFEKLIQNRGRF